MTRLIQSRPVRNEIILTRGETRKLKFQTRTSESPFTLENKTITMEIRKEMDFDFGIIFPQRNFEVVGDSLTVNFFKGDLLEFEEGYYFMSIKCEDEYGDVSFIYSGDIKIRNG